MQIQQQYEFDVYPKRDIVLVKGKNSRVWDNQGKEYIDCLSGAAGTTFIGWNRTEVTESVRKQLEFPHAFFGHINLSRVELAEKLVNITPKQLTKAWFACGGGEVNETAVKAAIKSTGKKEVISLFNGFHGISIAMCSLGHRRLREGFPIVPGFRQIPSPYCYRCVYGKSYPGCDFECARALETTIDFGSSFDVAAFLLEPIQGMGGHVYPPDKEYSKIIREICDTHNILIIADEVQTGFGRTGKMFACEHSGIQPDIVCLSKALAAGLPIGATVAKSEIANWDEGSHSNTFGGSLLSCAASLANIDVIQKENLCERASTVGSHTMKRLQEIREKSNIVGDVRGKGLMIGIEFVKDKETKVKAVEETGCRVTRVLAVVDREEGGKENLAREGYRLESIFTARELLAYE